MKKREEVMNEKNQKEEKRRRMKHALLLVGIIAPIYLFLILHYSKRYGIGIMWVKIAYLCLEIWMDKGLEMAGFFISIVLILPSISLKTASAKEFVDKNNKPAIIWGSIFFATAIVASLSEPFALCLFYTVVSFLANFRYGYIALFIIDYVAVIFTAIVPYYLAIFLKDIYHLYKDSENPDKKKSDILFCSINKSVRNRSLIKIHIISTEHNSQD